MMDYSRRLHAACKRIEKCGRPYSCRQMIKREARALGISYDELHNELDLRVSYRRFMEDMGGQKW